MAETVLPTEALAHAHDAIDMLTEKARTLPNADSVWVMAMSSVEGLDLTDDQKRQNLGLLLTVALQRLAKK